MIITIDGPVASGKSALARELAKRLHFLYLYSGLLYRGLSSVLINKYGYTVQALVEPKMADISAILDPSRFVYLYENGQESILFDGINITPHLKDPSIDLAASMVSPDIGVRKALCALQHKLVKGRDAVVEGRDAGTVVFPAAEYKFFLTAETNVRALRWQRMQEKRGIQLSFHEALALLQERDARDTHREVAPLAIAENAIIIDNSAMNLDQTVQVVLDTIEQATGSCNG